MTTNTSTAWSQTHGNGTPDIYDKIWSVPRIYENPQNSTLQSFALIGRYNGQYWSRRADQDDAREWDNRRMIAGFESHWFEHFTLQVQTYITTDDASNSYYDGLYEAFIEWAATDRDIAISVGRLDYLFTGLERSTSSKQINTVERGQLAVMLHERAENGDFSSGSVFGVKQGKN